MTANHRYQILRSDNISTLETKINSKVTQGFTLRGGLIEKDGMFYQAVCITEQKAELAELRRKLNPHHIKYIITQVSSILGRIMPPINREEHETILSFLEKEIPILPEDPAA